MAEHVGAAFRAEALRIVARGVRRPAGPAFLIATQVHHAIDVLAILRLGGADDALHLIAASHYGLFRQRPGQIANHLSALSGRARSGGAIRWRDSSFDWLCDDRRANRRNVLLVVAGAWDAWRTLRALDLVAIASCLRERSRRGGRWLDGGGLAFGLAHRLRQRLGLVGAADVAETRVRAQFRAALDTPHGDTPLYPL